jgi:hypothetical protein
LSNPIPPLPDVGEISVGQIRPFNSLWEDARRHPDRVRRLPAGA